MRPLFLGFRPFLLKDLGKIYQLMGLKPKNKGYTNFYECCGFDRKSISKVGTYVIVLRVPSMYDQDFCKALRTT